MAGTVNMQDGIENYVDLPRITPVPFDNTRTMRDAAGDPIRFLLDPLDEQYITAPGEWIPAGMLPPEEMEVRTALLEMRLFTQQLMSLGWLERLFHTKAYCLAHTVATEKQEALLRLVNSSRAHKAALRRIVSAMPATNGGREALARYTA